MEKNEHSFSAIYHQFWKRAFDFRGRSSQAEFWLPFVVHRGIEVLIYMLMLIVYMMRFDEDNVFAPYIIPTLYYSLIIFSLILLIPEIAVIVRRLHDVGRHGWWVVVMLLNPLLIYSINGINYLFRHQSASNFATFFSFLILFWVISSTIWFIIQLSKASSEWTNR
ncbi:DUF805 domain-containing protein [Macrococcus brunensis]|uniref:DUF805 domain-containing protein n=2 Tax=Macrococcus brunensis TaxID=198483 RepID=A0A4V6PPK4_9STAP|nr:DUF805 domain-containing protein [Macrococcus brunensis]TDL93449.1 DUF805 domain-containing protein [Macrococcus brunensis]